MTVPLIWRSANDSSLRPAQVDGPVSEESGSWTRAVSLDAIDSGQRMRYRFLARSRFQNSRQGEFFHAVPVWFLTL